MIPEVRGHYTQRLNSVMRMISSVMTPQARKVIIVTSVSLGIIALSFLIPTVIFPTYGTVQKSANCLDFNCAGNVYHKCETSQVSNSSRFIDMMENGIKGMMCMVGVSQVDTYFKYNSTPEVVSTFNSQSKPDD